MGPIKDARNNLFDILKKNDEKLGPIVGLRQMQEMMSKSLKSKVKYKF